MTKEAPLGAKVKEARRARGWSLADLSYELRAGYDVRAATSTLARLESGFIGEAGVHTEIVVAIAKVLGLELEDLSPFHAAARDRLLRVLVPVGYAAGDSNPEPTDYGRVDRGVLLSAGLAA